MRRRLAIVLVGLVIVFVDGSVALAASSSHPASHPVVQGVAGSGPATSERAVTASGAGLPAPRAGAEVYLRPSSGIFEVQGGGFGHGVGMSQYGANGAAAAGLTHAQILAFYYPGTSLVPGAKSTIRIGITVDNDGITRVGARPGLSLTTGGTTTTLPSAPLQWRVSASGASASSCSVESYDGRSWTAYRPGATPCPVVFTGTEGSVDLFLPSGERAVYRGAVEATHLGTTSLATVNSLTMQSYLRGVVPSEMPTSFQSEALKAQSVAARTYAARGSNGTSYYDTCDTTACQAYRGQGRRNADGSLTSYEATATDAAVAATDGQVLTYVFADGVTRLATTMYSSSNGGQTAAGSPGHGYLVAKADPYDAVAGNSRHAWSAELPASSLEARFGITRVERIQILGRDGAGTWGGRVTSVLVEGSSANGVYQSATTTGGSIMSARSWPAYSTGLSSNFFTIGGTSPVVRLAGADRYATAAAIADGYSSGVPVVYVASGADFPDALSGAARAAYNAGPLLLTDPKSLPSATRQAMTRLSPGRVVILGGPGAVSDAVAEQLRLLTTSGKVQRISGSDRFETAAAMSSFYSKGGVAYLASGEGFPDALAGAALAGRDKAPLLLTRAGVLPQATAAALTRLAPSKVVVLGGTGVISDAVMAAAAARTTTGSAVRLAGPDRNATAAAIAAQYPSATAVYLASGENFADGLAGAARAGRDRAPLLLTPGNVLPVSTSQQVSRLMPEQVWVLGGGASVSDAVAAAVRSLLR